MTTKKRQNEQMLTENITFRGHLSTFGAENTTKSRFFMAKNNAQILHNSKATLKKSRKRLFLPPKWF